MGRVREYVRVNGARYWALFDPGSRNCYVTPEVAKGFPLVNLPTPFKAALGGKRRRFKQGTIIFAKIKRKPVLFDAYVIDDLGRDEKGAPIDILFGALAMQKWGIELDLRRETLDLKHYPKEFVEYGVGQ